jgi:hypothetical protein
MRRPPAALLIGLALLILTGCIATPTPSPTTSPSPSPSPSPSATAAPSDTAEPTATASPDAALSLDLPDEVDEREVDVTIEPNVGPDGGEIVVTVTNGSDEMVEELVLRWHRELNRTLFLRPFAPSEQRIADGGPPLVQEWTKWVVGPGEEGEPAGTISLGWGPLMPGATLRIPVNVVRREDGPVGFDLQVLSETDQENEPLPFVAILTRPNGEPAEFRVEMP